MKKFQYGALGGTFDRLHAGHKAFLEFALQYADTLVIGLTSDEYVLKQKPTANILPYDKRKNELENFLHTRSKKFRIVSIDSNNIPEPFENRVNALFVTTDTLHGAEEINKKRAKRHLQPLPIIPFALVYSSDKKIIASTRIRKGEIDRYGKTYLTDQMVTHTYVLPLRLRKTLKQPIGHVIKTVPVEILSLTKHVITVGDVTTKTFLKQGITPHISVIDFVVERKQTYSSTEELGFSKGEYIYHLENKKSTISPGVFSVIAHIFSTNSESNRNSVIVITGEEDLIVLPLLLLAPLGAIVFYGQPKRGIVRVDVTETIKQQMRDLLGRFQKKLL